MACVAFRWVASLSVRLGLSAEPAYTISIEEAAKPKYTHFCILVIGRANAGKTTLLKRVCTTDEDPVYNT
ncbi:hypothetical protein H0H92_000800, partial [Tricholoma furcatifolium]